MISPTISATSALGVIQDLLLLIHQKPSESWRTSLELTAHLPEQTQSVYTTKT